MEEKLTPEESAILEELRQSIRGDDSQRSRLIPILQKVQERLGYLPPEAVKMVADHLAVPLSEVYSVATFYNQFRFHPPGKYPIKVCMGTACHVRGGEIILENFERKLEIKEGETTEDREFSIERVACVGCCALAPVALVGETVHGHMAPSKVEGLFTRIQVQKEIEEKRRKKDGSE
ncbi:MAG: NADH-quinone oxidoreductase subunit NuoE [Desulfobacteraceae bacterium]|jgi:NADH-quinone oxidoreductase subunit E|nr:NADH-quinone oxidoreductase subunit NuoE [Desulfobacteraceae bacterium]